MRENFEKSLVELLKHEGGYVNHPRDPGGRTNLGVTQDVWEDWIDRAVTEENMRALTPAKVAPLYRDMYWDRIKGDKLPGGVDCCVFDAAVNSGVFRATKWLQVTVGAVPDGVIGEQTLRQVALTNPQMLIDKYSANRLAFLQKLATWPTFGKGWERRVEEVRATALKLINSEVKS